METIEPGSREQQISDLCRALSHPLRLSIIQYIAAHPGCICNDIVVRTDRAQSTISDHLRILITTGLVDCEHEGQASVYHLSPGALLLLRQALDQIILAREKTRS